MSTNSVSKPGAEPTYVDTLVAERIGPQPDSTLIARSAGVAIWHTEKFTQRDVPSWLPPFSWDLPAGVLYRGFPADKLHNVLDHGLDVPPGCAFFATCHPDKAWEYPGTRPVAMLVLDNAYVEPSYARKPVDADDSWCPDKTLYPNAYTDGGRVIHTRFAPDRGTRCFSDELMYGRWVPGDARDALLAVVLGGPRAAVQARMKDVQGRCRYGVEFQ